jgi:hypothetical protein
MKKTEGDSYDPAIIGLMITALDSAWAMLTRSEQARTSRLELTLRILELAVQGERDPTRMTAIAVSSVKPQVGANLTLGRHRGFVAVQASGTS